jgi:hypothetical protein
VSDCSCIVVDDYDLPAFYQVQVVYARKPHQCCECHREIEPKEEYENVTGKWDGRLNRYKTCLDCLSVRHAFFCSGYLHEDMWEAVDNHLSDTGGIIESSCLEGMTPAGRARVVERIDELWEEDGLWEEED